MNTETKQAIQALDALRLPELQTRYREVLGEETRCPNRGFLVRKISDALVAADAAKEAAGAPGDVPTSDAEPTPAAASALQDAPPAAEPPTPVDAPRRPRARQRRARAAPQARPRRERPAATQRGRFSAMTVEELRAKYVELIQRPTLSTDKAYLIWKLREAEKGRIPLGPCQARRRDGEPVDVKTLPLRLESSAIDRMDRAWRALGIKSRTEFLRQAVGHYLAHLGATDAARAFGYESAATGTDG